MKILLTGPQGSGKSTQADLLAQYLNVPKISTGDIFRKIKQEDSEKGKRIRQILNSGQLVDDQTTAEIVKRRLAGEGSGFVMDGYPRTLEQINLFDPLFDKVFYLKLSDEEAIKRLLSRGREDDTRELIAQRLKIYHQQTDPVLDYYKVKGLLKEIDGLGSIDEIRQRIRDQLNG